MIHKKEFYFLRHGQTDHALGLLTDQYDIPLNPFGRQQASAIEGLIASLPVKTICFSPLKRAKETKEITTTRLQANKCEIADLKECTGNIWEEMTSLGPQAHLKATGSVQAFIEQVIKGMNQALSHPGPVLIVAHGGVHWATCCLMDVEHEWVIDNCIPVHFTLGADERWKAKKLV